MAESLSCGKANTIQLMVGSLAQFFRLSQLIPKIGRARPETFTTTEYAKH